MAINWFKGAAAADSCNLGPLALIWPLLQRMKVAKIIDQHLPADPQAEFRHGQVLSLLIAARLFQPVALVNVPQWAAASGADLLWDMPVEKMNDDRLGRSLDAFFTQRHSILASLALHVAREFDIPLSELHYDPTHILLHGAYAASQPRPAIPDADTPRHDHSPPAHITVGRPMSGARQDVRLVHAGLCTVVNELGPLPIFGHTVDGNQNGHTAILEQTALIRQHLRPVELTMISDRGTYSKGHLGRLHAAGYHALVAAPWKDFQALFEAHRASLQWKPASYLSLEQQRRRSQGALPQEHYELAVLKHQLTDESSQQTLNVRLVFVFSTADQKVAAKTREKAVQKLREGLERLQRSVAGGWPRTDPEAIASRVSKLLGSRPAGRCFRWEMVPLSPEEQRQQPWTPQRGRRRPTHRLEFSYDAEAAAQDAAHDGYSVLVAMAPLTQSADALFTKYKQQSYSELANHEFKTPLAVHPVFLKSPQRVEALVFLMMAALTLYFLLQRMYRQSVPAEAPAAERRTTTETLLRAFATCTLIVQSTRWGREVQTTRLSPRQRQILQQLGFATPAQVLSRQLPRAP